MNDQATQLDGILSQLQAKGASADEMSTVAKGFLSKSPAPAAPQPKVDTSQMPRSRLTGEQTPSGPVREYLDENTGKYVPGSQSSFGQRAKAVAEDFIDPAVTFLGSAARVPQDVVSLLQGRGPSQYDIPLPSGKTSKTIQAQAGDVTSDVFEGKTTPMEGTLNLAGQTVSGAGAVLGAADLIPKTADELPGLAHYVRGRIEGGDKSFKTALDDVTPEYKTATPTEKEKLVNQPSVNGTPRVQEGGFFSGRTVTSTPGEAEIANKLSTVPGYKPNMTMLDKSNLIQDQIAKEGNAMRASLQNESFVAPIKEITSVVRKAVNTVPENSLLLSKSDPVIKNYLRVVNNAANNISGDLEGVLNLKQTLDAAYKNARGNLAFGDARMTSLDEIHTAARDALTKYMIDNAKNTDVKSALRSQWLLYKANDIISAKAAKEGGSTVERLLQKPGIKTGVKIIKQAVPYGLGTHLPI